MTERDPLRPGWLFGLACAAAVAARLAFLGLRPLHHDEALNAWFLRELVSGAGYRYNPNAYHGPALYLLGWLPARLLGLGTVALRLPVALASASTLLLLLPLRRKLGSAGTTGAAWLLALSPSLVFYGRDLIHESYLAAATLGLVAAASSWRENRRRRDLLLACGALALLFTIKETAPLTVLALALAAGLANGRGRALRTLRGFLPGASAHTAGSRLAESSEPAAMGVRSLPRDLGWGALVFAAVWIAAFTTLFTHPGGFADSFRAYLPWLRKGVGGALHDKPWSYFPKLLWSFEAPILLGALAAGGLALHRLALRRSLAGIGPTGDHDPGFGNLRAPGAEPRDRFALFCALWAGLELLFYSAIPYKTPWLMINMVVPAALAAGALLRSDLSTRVRRGVLALFVFGLGWSGWRAIDAAFRRYDDPAIGLVYSDTRREVWELLAYLREAAARGSRPGGATLAAYLPTRWPLYWYLRDLPNATWRRPTEGTPEADIILSDRSLERGLRAVLGSGYERREFQLRPNVPVDVWVRRDPRPARKTP